MLIIFVITLLVAVQIIFDTHDTFYNLHYKCIKSTFYTDYLHACHYPWNLCEIDFVSILFSRTCSHLIGVYQYKDQKNNVLNLVNSIWNQPRFRFTRVPARVKQVYSKWKDWFAIICVMCSGIKNLISFPKNSWTLKELENQFTSWLNDNYESPKYT